jgi:stalled ribosome rescue protein Dom34
MSSHFHAIVWIDHHEAKVFGFNASEAEPLVVRTHLTGHHGQHKANVSGAGHLSIDRDFFNRVMAALKDVGAILLTGPAHAKLELKNYIDEHKPELAKRISAVEALDHPTDRELIALGRKFFKADDRMHAQR